MIFIEKKYIKNIYILVVSSNYKILVLYESLLVSYQVCKCNKFYNR